MYKRGAAVATVFPVLAAIMIGSAGPSEAAPVWKMPSTKGMILQNAVDAVRSATGNADLKFDFVPRKINQEVYNLTNWTVCATSPAAGGTISQKTKKVAFSVRRPNEKC